jgi:hypothetical protein
MPLWHRPLLLLETQAVSLIRLRFRRQEGPLVITTSGAAYIKLRRHSVTPVNSNKGQVIGMWEQVWKQKQMEIQMDAGSKAVRLRIGDSASPSGPQAGLELSQSEIVELLHTLLTINRSFQPDGSTARNAERQPARDVSLFSRQAVNEAPAIS